jgi:hypothetical protein
MPQSDMSDVDLVVTRWTNTKLSWRDNQQSILLSPGATKLSDATDQMNIAVAEMMGLFGTHDPLWWESFAELANLVRSKIQR